MIICELHYLVFCFINHYPCPCLDLRNVERHAVLESDAPSQLSRNGGPGPSAPGGSPRHGGQVVNNLQSEDRLADLKFKKKMVFSASFLILC